MSSESPIERYPKEWISTTLGDICAEGGGGIQTGPFGSQLHAADYVAEGTPSIMPKNISVERISTDDIAYITYEDVKRLSKYLVRKGDIVYSRRGDVEKCSLVTSRENGWLCGTGCLRVRLGDNSKVSSEFIHAYISHPLVREWIVRHSIGATMPNLNTSILSSVPVLIPSDNEMEVVETIWTGINKKIVLNSQINQTLDEIVQTIFKSWFVDFEPVKAKIKAKGNGQDPERAAMLAISGKTNDEVDQLTPEQFSQLSVTATLFPDELVDSELGSIPKGWEWSNIGKEVDVVGGGTPCTKVDKFWDDGIYNWTTPRDLSGVQEKVLLGTVRKITKAGLEKISSGLLPIDTVLLSSRAPVGYLALAKRPVAINQGYIAMKCSARLSPEFVLQWAVSVMDEIKQRASGTTFAEISKKNFRDIPVLVPDAKVVIEFQQQAAVVYEKIKTLIQESKSLEEIRDTLLPKLLSGEIELSGDVNE